jgi:hypothetical protein
MNLRRKIEPERTRRPGIIVTTTFTMTLPTPGAALA